MPKAAKRAFFVGLAAKNSVSSGLAPG